MSAGRGACGELLRWEATNKPPLMLLLLRDLGVNLGFDFPPRWRHSPRGLVKSAH